MRNYEKGSDVNCFINRLTTFFLASVNLTVLTNLVFNTTVILRCTSNNGIGTWVVFKGPKHDILFQDEAIGSGYSVSKYKLKYISEEMIEISIRIFEKSDIDVYVCSHKDKLSNILDMRKINHYDASVNLTLITDLVLNKPVKFKCTSNIGDGTWFVYKGPSNAILFQDEAIGSGYNTSKFMIEIISEGEIEIKINVFDANDVDVYICSHKDQLSNKLDMTKMKLNSEIMQRNSIKVDSPLVPLLLSITTFAIIMIVITVLYWKRKRNRRNIPEEISESEFEPLAYYGDLNKISTSDVRSNDKSVKEVERTISEKTSMNGTKLMFTDSNDRDKENDAIKRKNEDGLIYVELSFSGRRSGENQIRGSENRTNYAVIDFTMRAEPLPPDDDEEDD